VNPSLVVRTPANLDLVYGEEFGARTLILVYREIEVKSKKIKKVIHFGRSDIFEKDTIPRGTMVIQRGKLRQIVPWIHHWFSIMRN